MIRVLVIDADAISPVQAAPLMVPSDRVLVATNNRDVISAWKEQLGSLSQYHLEIVSSGIPQAADMALAFIAGKWVAREPSLLALPWLLVSRDKDISALASCLLARGVACVSQVHVHRYGAPSASSANSTLHPASPPAKPQPCHRRLTQAEKLDRVIRQAGGYPCHLGRVRPLLNKASGIREGSVLQKIRDGKTRGVKKYLVSLGFVCTKTQVSRFGGATQKSRLPKR